MPFESRLIPLYPTHGMRVLAPAPAKRPRKQAHLGRANAPRTGSELEMPSLKLLEDDDRKERLVQQIVGRQLRRPQLCQPQFWQIAGRLLRR